MCETCLTVTSDVSKLRGNGDRIFVCNESMPKVLYVNIEKATLNPNRNTELRERAEDALFGVHLQAKDRYKDVNNI